MAVADQAAELLKGIVDAGSNQSVVDLGWLDRLRIDPPRAVLRLNLPGFAQGQRDRIVAEARERLLALETIQDVQIEVGTPPSQGGIGQAGHGQAAERQPIPGVKQVIAVSSGKGGVGKSTVAVNLACSLAKQGLRVGLLDADIYGPNAPIMLGVADQSPEVSGSGDDQRMIPLESCGVAVVSMGLLIEENQPVIWRGPMLNGIIRQFLYQVDWSERDVVIVDLPPGTGDAQLSLAQAVPMAGVVIVTTPQKVALQDARRGLAMFLQMGVPVLGVVENMSGYTISGKAEPGSEIEIAAPAGKTLKATANDEGAFSVTLDIFKEGGGRLTAEEFGVPFLGALPFDPGFVRGGDDGVHRIVSEPEGASAIAFSAIVSALQEQISEDPGSGLEII